MKRNPINRTAKVTASALESFQQHGGHFVEVPLEWLADSQALIDLRREVKAGRLRTPDGITVTMEDFIRFMQTDFHSGLTDRLRGIVGGAAA